MIGILGKWTRLKNLDVKFTNFLLESNLVGRLIKSTVIALEHTLIDSDTISKFHRKNMIVGTYTLYPLDTHAVRNKSADQEQILTKMIGYGVDWIETDEPDKVMNLLDKMN
jgi:glycerophosphoryl diester phosphodiesterase